VPAEAASCPAGVLRPTSSDLESSPPFQAALEVRPLPASADTEVDVAIAAPSRIAGLSLSTALAMYVLIALSYVVNSMDRSVFSNLVSAVNSEFHLSLAQGGFLTTVFAIGFGLTGICAGFLLDRWTRKSTMVVGMAIYSVFTLVIPLAQGFWDMGSFRLITGIGEAMQQTAIFTMAGVFFAQHRNLAIGGMNVAYGLGSFVGPLLGTQLFLVTGENWRPPLYVFGGLGLAFAVVVMFTLSKRFSEYGKDAGPTAAAPREEAPAGPWLNRNLVLLAIANVTLGLLNYGYLGLYPTFLKSVLHFSVGTAAVAQSLYGVGAFTGIVAGYLADRFGERPLIYVAVFGSMVSGLLMFTVATVPWEQDLLSFFFGTFASGFLFVNVYAMTQRAVAPQHVGKASGIASSAHYIGAGFAGAVFGGIVQAWSWGGATIIQMVLLPAIAIVCVAFVRMAAVGDRPSTA
jgi:MFS family permease